MAVDITSILGGSLGETAAKIIGMFKLSPEKKAEFEAALKEQDFELQKMQNEMQQKLLEEQAREIDIAGQNIRAETASGDKYTARSRPSFIYVMLSIFVANYILFPLINKPALQFPDALFWLFGSCMLGYTGARTWEKFAGMPGDSQMEVKAPLGFAIKAGNNTKGK